MYIVSYEDEKLHILNNYLFFIFIFLFLFFFTTQLIIKNNFKNHIPDAKMSCEDVALLPGSEVVLRDLEAALPNVETEDGEELCQGPLSSAEKSRKISSLTELTQVNYSDQ